MTQPLAVEPRAQLKQIKVEIPHLAVFSQEDDQVANRIDAHPDITARLRTIAQDHLDTNADFEVKAIKLDEMQLDQLRALGYELP